MFSMQVYVLLYDIGTPSEGIRSIEVSDKTIVIMFEDKEDAERYCGLLEAQDFPLPSIEFISKKEVEEFCLNAGYEFRFVERGFRPQSEEDRLLIAPPQKNLEIYTRDQNDTENSNKNPSHENNTEDLDSFRKNLENLI